MAPIYLRCLRCLSEKTSIAGQIPYRETDIATCRTCGATFPYGDLVNAAVERVKQGNPNPTPLN